MPLILVCPVHTWARACLTRDQRLNDHENHSRVLLPASHLLRAAPSTTQDGFFSYVIWHIGDKIGKPDDRKADERTGFQRWLDNPQRRSGDVDKHFTEMWRFVMNDIVNMKFSKKMQNVLAVKPAIELEESDVKIFSNILKEAAGDLNDRPDMMVRPVPLTLSLAAAALAACAIAAIAAAASVAPPSAPPYTSTLATCAALSLAALALSLAALALTARPACNARPSPPLPYSPPLSRPTRSCPPLAPHRRSPTSAVQACARRASGRPPAAACSSRRSSRRRTPTWTASSSTSIASSSALPWVRAAPAGPRPSPSSFLHYAARDPPPSTSLRAPPLAPRAPPPPVQHQAKIARCWARAHASPSRRRRRRPSGAPSRRPRRR